MNHDAVRHMIRTISDLADLFDRPNLLPAVEVHEHSAGYLLRSIAVELGKKAEEAKE